MNNYNEAVAEFIEALYSKVESGEMTERELIDKTAHQFPDVSIFDIEMMVFAWAYGKRNPCWSF